MIYVLDACALIAVFNNEASSCKVRDLLLESLSGKTEIIMSPINLTEVYYDMINTLGFKRANEIYKWIKAAIFIPDKISDSIILEAGRLKSKYRCSLGDAYGLATATEFKGQFVTADHHELEKIEKQESIKFFWFR